MKISVVMPAYNSEKTIGQAIESVLKQDYKIDEIIVVDDGSKDKTAEIASRYPIKLIKKQNGGEASALNIGAKQSQGDFIAIIESDVIIPPNWLSLLIKEFKDPQVYGVGALLEVANPENLISKLSGYELEYRYLKIKEKFVPHITSANTLYKKEVFDKVGYYDESLINACLDADLNSRLINQGYKLVLLKNIKVKHFWKTNLGSFLKRQWLYALYRPYLKNISLYPTDKMLTVQIGLTAGFILSIFLWPLGYWFKLPFYWLILFFLIVLTLCQIPMISKIYQIKKDLTVLWLIPLIFLKNIVGLSGYSFGLIYKYLKS